MVPMRYYRDENEFKGHLHMLSLRYQQQTVPHFLEKLLPHDTKMDADGYIINAILKYSFARNHFLNYAELYEILAIK